MASLVSSQSPALNISVGIPSPILSLINGTLLRRLLTLEPFVDFYQMDLINKVKVIAKVIFVGAIALGIAASVAYMSHITVAAIPLCLICTMGLSFNYLTEDISLAAKKALGLTPSDQQCKL